MTREKTSDCISRTQAIERLKLNLPISQGADNSRDRHRYMQGLADIQAIRELPSVTPQEPKSEFEHDHEILKAYSDGSSDILCKIRSEIAELSHYYPMGQDYQIAITRCIAVIDKYKAESEDT